MEKINIAELLKDCPKGMELDCICADNVVFDKIFEYEQIKCVIGECRDPLILDKYGRLLHICCPKCVIFPKGKATWEGFVPPCKFKDGDVVTDIEGAVIIYKEITTCGYCGSFVSLDCYNQLRPHYQSYLKDCIRLATEGEKQKLLDAIKADGFHWNAETKTLVKLPKFKVGDRIRHKENGNILKIVEIDMSDSTYCCGLDYVWVEDQDNYELVPNNFDITTLKPFDSRVLVRDSVADKWMPNFFGCLCDGNYPYMIIGGSRWNCCIPFEGNEHLMGKTDDCDDFYKTWE